MTTSNPRTMQIGQATICITNDHEFFNGWQAGYLAFHASDKAMYSDEDILQLVQARMLDHENSPLYNAGYVTAWLNALMKQGFRVSVSEWSTAGRQPLPRTAS